MLKRIVAVISILLLSISLLTFTYTALRVTSKSEIIMDSTHNNSQIVGNSHQSEMKNTVRRFEAPVCPQKVDLRRIEDLRSFARCEGESVELVVGVNASVQQIKELEEIIRSERGRITSTIAMNEEVQAITVFVQTNNAHFFAENLVTNKLVRYVEPNLKVEALFTPNDPYWNLQWGPKKVEADAAWNVTIGSHEILVAIVDTGIYHTHVDLSANYVPLGYDWANNDLDPVDDHGHGSHCAGIASAVLNNSVGIAGLAQARIMAEKVLTGEGWGYDTWVAQGIIHATDQGAKIISMSLGAYFHSTVLYDAVRYAYNHGVLIVAAAGNEHTNESFYPAAYDEVIAVAATDRYDETADFSNFGTWIELSAPGVDIYSTVLYNGYTYYSGTSMACPHVTGVAALAWGLFPELTRDEVRQLLRYSADDLGEEGFDQYYGYGRVNARKAVQGFQDHDLCITKWQQLYRIEPGQTCMFNVTILNRGRNDETSVPVHFLVNETLTDVETIDLLNVGASIVVSFPWSTVTQGNYNVTCYVVPVIGENLTENNVIYSQIAVRPPTTLRVPNDYSTVKEAVEKAGQDDRILVSEGTYLEGRIDILKDNITLLAEGHVTLYAMPTLSICANYVVVEGFEIRTNTNFDVNAKGNNNVFSRNHIINKRGLRIYDSANSTLSSNNITCSLYGIVVDRSENIIINQNKIISTDSLATCLYVSWSSNITVIQNTVIDGSKQYGLFINQSHNSTITSNIVMNSWYGLVLSASPYNVFRNNVLANNTCNFFIIKDDVIAYLNDVDASNTVDGKPICYWINVHDAIVPSDAGCVVLMYCRNIKVENLTLKNNFNGILLIDTHDTVISRNNFSENRGDWFDIGGDIVAFGCSNNTITLNNMKTCYGYGVYMLGGSNNSVIQNNMSGTFGNEYSILLSSSNSVISWNNITGCFIGIRTDGGSNNIIASNNVTSGNAEAIYIYGSYHVISSNIAANFATGIRVPGEYCTVSFNNVTGNWYGVWLEGWLNTFYGNNFVDNRLQVLWSAGENLNFWNRDYPFGGNYWSNYTGLDNKSGSLQNILGSDGIGDTPHAVGSYNLDFYPLMRPWVSGSTHDVAIDVQTSKTLVGEGCNVRISVPIANQGDSSEIVTIRVHVDANEVDSKAIILSTENFITDFMLNATGLARGNHTIMVYAEPVQNETDIIDNNSTGWVIVTIMGDVTSTMPGLPDYRVDMRDIGAICSSFMAAPSSPRWDPNCDVNGDDVINMRDLGVACNNFMKT